MSGTVSVPSTSSAVQCINPSMNLNIQIPVGGFQGFYVTFTSPFSYKLCDDPLALPSYDETHISDFHFSITTHVISRDQPILTGPFLHVYVGFVYVATLLTFTNFSQLRHG